MGRLPRFFTASLLLLALGCNDKVAPTPGEPTPVARTETAPERTETAVADRPAAVEDEQCNVAPGSIDCADSPRTSPFVCVRFTKECSVEVQLETSGEFHPLVSVEGVPPRRSSNGPRPGAPAAKGTGKSESPRT